MPSRCCPRPRASRSPRRLILDDPASISSPFFLLVPGWARLPIVFLATAATVVASQAVITDAFSVTQQAAQIGCVLRWQEW